MTGTEKTREPAVDPYVLGVFRIAFGLVCIFAALDLVPFMGEHFSDQGWMPRSAYLADHARPFRFSLMDVCGRAWHVWVYFAATFAALACMTVGFHTRVATVASFFLVTGIHERNTFPFDGSDNVIRVMLFFMMFADLDRALSVDASLRGDKVLPPPRYVPVRLLELQTAFVYLAATAFKLAGPLWLAGTAARNGLLVPHSFSRAYAAPLADIPAVVHALTWGTIAAESILGLGLAAPRRFVLAKRAAVLTGITFHLGTVVLMNVGNFPIVMAATYLLHLPRRDVERLGAFFEQRLIGPVAKRVVARGLSAPGRLRLRLGLRVLVARDAGLALLFAMVVWNGLPKSSIPQMPACPPVLTAIVQTFEVWQQWDMFAPNPIINDYFVVGHGRLVDGTNVDPLEDAPGGAIAVHHQGFPYRRWTKVMNTVGWGTRTTLLPFGRYICRRWNPGPKTPDALDTFQLVRHEFPIGGLGAPREPEKTTVIWEHRCWN